MKFLLTNDVPTIGLIEKDFTYSLDFFFFI